MSKNKFITRTKLTSYESGYSFLEILIVLIVVGLGLAAIAVNTSASLNTLAPEEVLSQTANLVLEAKSQALLGSNDKNKLTFDIKSVLALNHNGVTVSTLPNSYGKGCETASITKGFENEQEPSKYSFCLSGKPFYFSASKTITFERFSGKMLEPFPSVFFFSSTKRKLALVVTQTGDTLVAEQINDVWRSRTDIQNLYKQEQIIKNTK